MKLSELLRRRSALAAQSSELASKASEVSAELGRVDAELFARMKSLVVAIEGGDADVVEAIPAPENGASATTSLFEMAQRRVRPVMRRSFGLGAHIVSALSAAGRPMDRNEIYDALISRSIDVPGKDPKANLSAHLSYLPTVTRTEDGLWALKESVSQ